MKFSFVFALLLTTGAAYSQFVDNLRLGYEAENIDWTMQVAAASPDGRYIGFVYRDADKESEEAKKGLHIIRIFDLTQERFVATLPRTMFLRELTFTAKDEVVYFEQNQTGALKVEPHLTVYDMKARTKRTVPNFGKTVGDLYYSKAHNAIVVLGFKSMTSSKRILTCIDASTLEVRYTRELAAFNLSSQSNFTFDKDGQHLVYLSDEIGNFIHVLDLGTGNPVKRIGPGRYQSVSFDQENKLSVIIEDATDFKDLEVFDFSNDFAATKYDLGRTIKVVVPEFAHRYGNILFAGSSKGLKAIDILTGTLKYESGSDAYLGFPRVVRLPGGKLMVYYTSSIKGDERRVFFNNARIFDPVTVTMAGYWYSDAEDYCVVSRDGLVDGSVNALKKVFWTSRKSSERTYLERTIDNNFTPGLLSMILQGKTSDKVFEIDNVISKVPVLSPDKFNGQPMSGLELKSSSKKNTITIKCTTNSSEVSEVRLHQNGKLVKALPYSESGLYSFDMSLTTAYGSTNYFYVVATSKSGVDAERIKFTVDYSGASDERPKLYLFTIGINKYKNPKYNLNYAEADADGVQALVKEKCAGLFPEIVNYSVRNEKAVKAEIIKTLESIKSSAKEQDIILFYYAGHGVMSQEAEAQFYLVPHDVTQLYSSAEAMREKGISAAELKEYSQKINAQKQIFILDACQSAGALESLALRGAAEEKAIAQLARSTGTFWITSTGADQFASEFDQLGHGLFTYVLIDGLKGNGDMNKDQQLSIRELSTYVENTIPELSEKLKGSPQFPSAYSFGNDFILSLFKQ